jgi:hypothetical protein
MHFKFAMLRRSRHLANLYMAIDNHFLKMIAQLRQHEEVMLYGNLLHVTQPDLEAIIHFLEQEYNREVLQYPSGAPPFHAAAASWSAQLVYKAAQLMLYRENKPEDLRALLPVFTQEQNDSAILSADLCLRFIPAMREHLHVIDPEDPLLVLLDELLIQWHYSGISAALDISKLDLGPIVSSSALLTLYTERIIYYRKTELAKHPLFLETIRASLGIYGDTLWKEFKDVIIPEP